MWKRYSWAFAGACVVTVTLFLGMSRIAELFERQDSQVYMRVFDFIPGSGARRLPDRRMPQAQPERARLESDDVVANGLQDVDIPAEFVQETDEIEVRVELDQAPLD